MKPLTPKKVENFMAETQAVNRVKRKMKELQSEPHQIVRCIQCDEAKHLIFKRSDDDQMYYVCDHCGFESAELGPAPWYLS